MKVIGTVDQFLHSVIHLIGILTQLVRISFLIKAAEIKHLSQCKRFQFVAVFNITFDGNAFGDLDLFVF